jgi:octaprenyl-diphosphate synthase
MTTDVALLDRIIRYVLKQKGKRIRPTLVLLSAKIVGSISDVTYRGAVLVELLHSATLIHDDVVDNAETRRGLFSVNALWKNKIAVLFGDYLLSRGLLLSLEHRDYELLQTMASAVKRMSEGELLQIEKSRKLDIDEETYFRIISDKTGSLISACTATGALSAGADPDTVDMMNVLGEKLGLAFQIRDDLFDFGERDVGKPTGIDLKERKLTLPLIQALAVADRSECRAVLKAVRKKRKTREDVRSVSAFVRRHGGIDYARERMNDLATEARSILHEFPPSDARDAFDGLIRFTVTRSS